MQKRQTFRKRQDKTGKVKVGSDRIREQIGRQMRKTGIILSGRSEDEGRRAKGERERERQRETRTDRQGDRQDRENRLTEIQTRQIG